MPNPHIIVLGNEKGGSGKSTTAMHVAIALLLEGHQVGTIDLDARQASLSRYIENRQTTAQSLSKPLLVPKHIAIALSAAENKSQAIGEDEAKFVDALKELGDCDFIVIDSPGADTTLSRIGHNAADTLITPLNDSFLDLDVLGRIGLNDGAKKNNAATIIRPSVYSEMVWERRKQRAIRGQRPIDWIVLRNRLSHLDALNKREMERLVGGLAQRIGFRIAPGLTERVIYRELFPYGLTLFDLGRDDITIPWRMSHVAARKEMRDLMESLDLSGKNSMASSLDN